MTGLLPYRLPAYGKHWQLHWLSTWMITGVRREPLPSPVTKVQVQSLRP
jgi:hypothetical protein